MKKITTLQKIKGWGRSKLKLLTFLLMLFAGFSATAQFTFPAVAGPTDVPGGTTGVTLNINDATNTEGVPAGIYESYTVTVDWVSTDNAWSSETRIEITTASGSTGEITADNATSNGSPIELIFSGNFNGYYEPAVRSEERRVGKECSCRW